MKHIKHDIIFFGAVAIAVLMVSSATAVPQVNSEPINEYLGRDELEDEIENTLGINDAGEFDIEELVQYFSEEYGVGFGCQQGNLLNINSTVNYYSVNPEEIMDFLVDFYDSDELYAYWVSDELSSLAADILDMITDWQGIEELANNLLTISQSSEFNELVEDIETLIEDDPFIQSLGEDDDIILLIDQLCQLTAYVILILLLPIEIFGYNIVTVPIVFPIAMVLASPVALCLGILIATLDSRDLFFDLLEEAEIAIEELLLSLDPVTWGILIPILGVFLGTVAVVIAIIIILLIILPLSGLGTFLMEAMILMYLDEYWQEFLS